MTGRTSPRRIARILLGAVGVFVIVVAAAAVALYLARPYWDLKGNFLPNFRVTDQDVHERKIVEERRSRAEAAASPASPVAQTASDAPDWSDPAVYAWPVYRGPDRDGRYAGEGLLQQWPADGPPELWRVDVGGGYAGIVVGGGRLYTIEQRLDEEVVTCYDFADGDELWAFAYDAEFVEQMGGDGPRATPTLHEGRLYALGAEGHFHCLDATTGELLWATNVLKDADSQNLPWGTSGAPLIVDDNVVVTATGLGGPGVLAYDKLSGELVWGSIPEQQAYPSLMLERIAGDRQLINFAGFSLNGLEAESGRLLWSFPWTGTDGINCAQPLVVGENRVWISSGYGKGCALIEVTQAGEGFETKELWSNLNMKNKFSSSILDGDHIYGLDEGILACIAVADGSRAWKGGRYGHGQLLYADGNLIVLGEMGQLALVRATPDAHTEISSIQALRGKTWNTPAIADGRLIVRNTTEMVCYDLRDPAAESDVETAAAEPDVETAAESEPSSAEVASEQQALPE